MKSRSYINFEGYTVSGEVEYRSVSWAVSLDLSTVMTPSKVFGQYALVRLVELVGIQHGISAVHVFAKP